HVGITVKGSGSARFRIVHAGKLGSNEVTGRSSAALLTALFEFLRHHPDHRSSVELLLVGPEDAGTSATIAQLGLDDVVRTLGRVSYEDSLGYIASASVCVLVEGDFTEGIFLPSKLADYIA